VFFNKNGVIRLEGKVEELSLIVYLKTPPAHHCRRTGQEESYKLVFDIVYCISKHSTLSTLHLPMVKV